VSHKNDPSVVLSKCAQPLSLFQPNSIKKSDSCCGYFGKTTEGVIFYWTPVYTRLVAIRMPAVNHGRDRYYRVAKKVSHYQESSLKRIKNCQCGYIAHQF